MIPRSFGVVTLLVGAIAGAAALGARQTAAPAGTAELSGILVTNTSVPQPVRRAIVRAASATGANARTIATDDAGRFAFPSMPAGTFFLSATKVGYVPAFYGSKHPGRGPGVPIALADGRRVDVMLKIAPGAVITGVITDARGRAASLVPVAAIEVRPRGAVAAASARATTDDLGVYRIFGLAAGDYVLAAMPQLRMGRAGVPTEILSMAPPGRPVTYAPVFYPGTANASGASLVTLAAGDERTNVSFSLQVVPTARVSGTVIDQNGRDPGSAFVSLYPRRRAQSSASDALLSSGVVAIQRGAVTGRDFSVAGVTPGDYTVVARTGSLGRGAAGATPAETSWSVTDLTVAGADQTTLAIRLQPGGSVSGTVAFDPSSTMAPTGTERSELTLSAIDSPFVAPSTYRAIVDATGSFRFGGLAPGTYLLGATPPAASSPRPWTLKSAIVKGQDIADRAIDVQPGTVTSGVAVTFADRESKITGVLADAAGHPVTRYSIVVFTLDRTLWLPNARRVRVTRPATDGSFSLAGLPAGEYAIAAAEDVEAADLADPTYLTQLLVSASRIAIGEGETKVQNLRIGG